MFLSALLLPYHHHRLRRNDPFRIIFPTVIIFIRCGEEGYETTLSSYLSFVGVGVRRSVFGHPMKLTVPVAKAVDDIVEAVVDTATGFFTEENVATHGRGMLLALAGTLWMVGLERKPKDAAHATTAHLPQGYDRSVLASKLQARRTKQQVNEILQVTQLRDQIRSTTNKKEKMALFNELRSRVLTGVVAGAYLHVLTLQLFCIRNTIKVLIFVLQKRRAGLNGARNGIGSLFATWWRVGIKGVLLQKFTDCLSPSPFANDRIDDAVGIPAADPMLGFMLGQPTGAAAPSPAGLFGGFPPMANAAQSGQGWPVESPVRVSSPALGGMLAGASTTADVMAALERAFSVRQTLETAIPRVLDDAREVVREMLLDPVLGPRISPATTITQHDLEVFFEVLTDRMDRRVCVSSWMTEEHRPTFPAGGSKAAPPSTSAGAGAVPTPQEDTDMRSVSNNQLNQPQRSGDEEDDDADETEKVQFSQLEHLQQKAVEAAVVGYNSSVSEGGLTTSTAPPPGRSSAPPPPPLPLLPPGQAGSPQDGLPLGWPSDLMGMGGSPASAGAMLDEPTQYAESFQTLIHTVSVGELVLADGLRVLRATLRKVLVKDLKKYDDATDAAPVIMVITKLEELRQKLANDEFTVPEYTKLFCAGLNSGRVENNNNNNSSSRRLDVLPVVRGIGSRDVNLLCHVWVGSIFFCLLWWQRNVQNNRKRIDSSTVQQLWQPPLLLPQQNRWECLRKEARQYEAILTQKTVTLERKAVVREVDVIDPQELGTSTSASASGPVSPLEERGGGGKRTIADIQKDFQRAGEEVQVALQSYQNVLLQMYDISRALPPTHPHHHIIQRLQSVVDDKQAALHRAQKDFTRQMNRLQLLPSIRKDVEAFKESAEVRFMMDEQQSLRSTQARVNRILDQADSTHDMLRSQHERFQHAAGSLVKLVERVPIIKRTLGRIDQKRRREVVCLGTIVGCCFFLAILFW
eukprot:gene8126-5661_t